MINAHIGILFVRIWGHSRAVLIACFDAQNIHENVTIIQITSDVVRATTSDLQALHHGINRLILDRPVTFNVISLTEDGQVRSWGNPSCVA